MIKYNKKILRAAKGANRWAKYACIIALLSFLAFVAAWIYEHSQSLIATSQQIEKVKTSPTQLLSTNETSDTSNGKHQIPQEKSEIKNKQVES